MYGGRVRDCRFEKNGIRLTNSQKFCFQARLEDGDTIKIIPIGEGLYGGSQKKLSLLLLAKTILRLLPQQ
jgi:hypothetical protein